MWSQLPGSPCTKKSHPSPSCKTPASTHAPSAHGLGGLVVPQSGRLTRHPFNSFGSTPVWLKPRLKWRSWFGFSEHACQCGRTGSKQPNKEISGSTARSLVNFGRRWAQVDHLPASESVYFVPGSPRRSRAAPSPSRRSGSDASRQDLALVAQIERCNHDASSPSNRLHVGGTPAVEAEAVSFCPPGLAPPKIPAAIRRFPSGVCRLASAVFCLT